MPARTLRAPPRDGAGQRLREIRTARGVSQRELARLIDVAVGSVQNYERGRVDMTLARIEQIASALNIQPADLFAKPGAELPKFAVSAPRLIQPERLNLWPVGIGFYSRLANTSEPVNLDRAALAACGLAANAPGSMALQDWWKRLHSDDHALVKSEYARLDRVGVFAAHYRLTGWDGVERTIIDCGRMACDERGQPARLSGTVIDITRLRRTAVTDFNIALLLKVMRQT